MPVEAYTACKIRLRHDRCRADIDRHESDHYSRLGGHEIKNESRMEESDRVESMTGADEEFFSLVSRYTRTPDPGERKTIDEQIWRRYGTRGVSFISDMSSFSATTRTLGICHFLGLIQRMRDLVPQFVTEAGGTLLKCETDNCYAYFPDADGALRASVRINEEVARINAVEDDDHQMYLSIGIDSGEMLLIGDVDFYGDPVNTASKLGEDLAGRSETLITDRALAEASVVWLDKVVWRESEISGIRIRYACLRHDGEAT